MQQGNNKSEYHYTTTYAYQQELVKYKWWKNIGHHVRSQSGDKMIQDFSYRSNITIQREEEQNSK